MDLNIKREKDGTVVITATSTPEMGSKAKTTALQRLAPQVTVEGFRPGKAPAHVAEKSIKQEKLLEETLSFLSTDIYTQAVEKEKLQPITRPQIEFPSLEHAKTDEEVQEIIWPALLEKGLEVKMTTYTVPDIELGDWKKIAKSTKFEEPKKESKKEVKIETASSIEDAKEKSEDHSDHQHEDATEPPAKPDGDIVLEQLTEKVKFDIPEALIHGEVQQRLMRQAQTMQQLGISLEDYLKTQKKSIEDLEKEMLPDAEKTVRARFIIGKIAEAEGDKFGEESTIADVVEHVVGVAKGEEKKKDKKEDKKTEETKDSPKK